VSTPEDLKNLLIRSPENEANVLTINAMGAKATTIPFTELFMALMTGVVDGQENPIARIYSMKFYEVQKYISLTNHVIESSALLMNEQSFNRIPEQYKEIFFEECDKWSKETTQIYEEQTEKNLEDLKEAGMIIIEPDRKAFRERVLSILQPYYYKTFGKELYEEILQAGEK